MPYFFAATGIETPDRGSCPRISGGVAFSDITQTFFAMNGYLASI
jgi:hypothetical protein